MPLFLVLGSAVAACSGATRSAIPDGTQARAPNTFIICPDGTDCPTPVPKTMPPIPTPSPTPTGVVVPVIWDDSRRELQTVATDAGNPHVTVTQGGTATLTVYCTNCYSGGATGIGTPFSVNWFSQGAPPGVSVSFVPPTTSGGNGSVQYINASGTALPGNWAYQYYVCRVDIPSVCSDYTTLDLTVLLYSTGPTGAAIPPAIWAQASADKCQPGSGMLGNGCAFAVNRVLNKVMGHKIPLDNDTTYTCHRDGRTPHVCQSVWVPDVIEYGLAKGYLQQIAEQNAQPGDITVQDGANFIDGMQHVGFCASQFCGTALSNSSHKGLLCDISGPGFSVQEDNGTMFPYQFGNGPAVYRVLK